MTRIRLQYVHEFRDRHGKPRRYFRRPGFKRVRLPGLPGSQVFMDAYQSALDGGARIEIGATRSVAGTVGALVSAYLSGIGFNNLAPETQRSRRGILDASATSMAAGVSQHYSASTYKRWSPPKPAHHRRRGIF